MGILSGLVIATSGTVDQETPRIRKWVLANGGRWCADFKKDTGVTHLIVSKTMWKASKDTINKICRPNVNIVSYDWLEDSLLKKRKLSAQKYAWKFLAQQQKQKREFTRLGPRVDGKKFQEGCARMVELTGSGTSKDILSTRKAKNSSSFFFQAEEIAAIPLEFVADSLPMRQANASAPPDVVKAGLTSRANGHDNSENMALAKAAASRPFSDSSKMPPRLSHQSASSSLQDLTTSIESFAKVPSIKDTYSYYVDATGFQYKVTLARCSFSFGGARYYIGLMQSHAKPHTYCTIVQYDPVSKKALEPCQNVPDVVLKKRLEEFLKEHEKDNAEVDGVHSRQKVNAGFLETVAPPTVDVEKEMARLSAIISPIVPNPEKKYSKLICPMNSDFHSAFRAFRYVFRDLTLTKWEERFNDRDKILSKSRAQKFGIEPYAYNRPLLGLSGGLFPQEQCLFQNSEEGYEDYEHNSFELPSASQPLSDDGPIGLELRQDKDRKEKMEAAKRQRVQEEAKKKGGVELVQKKTTFNKPFFNSTIGRPVTGACGQNTSSIVFGNCTSKVHYREMVKKRRPFPSQRD